MNLELFMTTMKEYERFSQQLPYKSIKIGECYDDATYVAVQTRLVLLRKYTSKGKKNNVYLENLINEAKEIYPEENDFLNDIQTRFLQISDVDFEQILSDGTKLNLYESIEDVMYGLLLHADQEKILRLSYSNEQMRFYSTQKYVEDIEKIVFELYSFLKKCNVGSIEQKTPVKAQTVFLGNSDSSQQNIKKSPYWSNMYGHDITEEDIKSILPTEEESQILSLAKSFFYELNQDKISVDRMKSMVYEPQIELWGDFSKVALLFKSIPEPGMSSYVRFNDRGDTACVRIHPHVPNGFVISSPHVIVDVYELTFIKDADGLWKVFSFGGHKDPYKLDSD